MLRFLSVLSLAALAVFLTSCGTGPALNVKDTTRTFTTVVVDPSTVARRTPGGGLQVTF